MVSKVIFPSSVLIYIKADIHISARVESLDHPIQHHENCGCNFSEAAAIAATAAAAAAAGAKEKPIETAVGLPQSSVLHLCGDGN